MTYADEISDAILGLINQYNALSLLPKVDVSSGRVPDVDIKDLAKTGVIKGQIIWVNRTRVMVTHAKHQKDFTFDIGFRRRVDVAAGHEDADTTAILRIVEEVEEWIAAPNHRRLSLTGSMYANLIDTNISLTYSMDRLKNENTAFSVVTVTYRVVE